MKALRIQVERVVRPIRASSLRKDRMREELLVHLTRLFEEELSRTGDAQSAVAEAIRRFGDAAQLTRELQASVPWLERWAFLSLGGPIRRRVGESPVRYLLRIHGWVGAAGGTAYLLLGAVVMLLSSARPHRADAPAPVHAFVFLMCVGALQLATSFGWALLGEWIRQDMEQLAAAASAAPRRKAAWRIAGYAAASSLLLAAAPATLMLLVEAFIPVPLITRGWFWSITLGAAALGPLFTLKHAVDWKNSIRRYDAWESLDLDEQLSA